MKGTRVRKKIRDLTADLHKLYEAPPYKRDQHKIMKLQEELRTEINEKDPEEVVYVLRTLRRPCSSIGSELMDRVVPRCKSVRLVRRLEPYVPQSWTHHRRVLLTNGVKAAKRPAVILQLLRQFDLIEV